MRRFLTALVLVECVLLLGGAVVLGMQGDRFRRRPPVAPTFRPSLYDAVVGDSVRYRRVDPADENRDLGYVDFEIKNARVLQNAGSGVEFNVAIVERDPGGGERRRLIRIQPRLLDHGFLPPSFEELDALDVPGGRPVIRSIRTAEVPGGAGFLVETVVPREGLDKVAGRLFLRPDVPVFGVVRWERGHETWILHRSHREERREAPEGE